MQIGELFYKITGDTSGLDKSLKKTDSQVKTAGKGLSGLGGILKGAAFAGAAVFAAKKVVELGGSLITAASDAEETRNKFSVVFRDVADEAEAAATSLSDNFGLSSNAAKTLLSDTGDLLTGFGFTGESALDLSTQVNELAVDLASFTNFSGGAEGASQALTKALLGERESVKALGISILDADVKAKVFENTQAGLTFETERQAKAYATLQIAQEQSQNAIGDFARSSESFANQQRIAAAAVDDLKVALGESLLPIATESVSVFGGLTRKLAEFIEERNRLKKVEEAATAGKGSISDQIAGIEVLNRKIEEQIIIQQTSIATLKAYNQVGTTEIALIEEQIAAKRQQIQANIDRARNLAIEAQAIKAVTIEEKAAAEIAAAREEADNRRLDKQKEYIKFIEDEYAGTEQAKVEKLQEEIALIEKNIGLFGGLREEQQLLIDLKKQEIDTILNKEAVEDEALAKTKEYHQALVDINSISATEEIAIQKAKNEEIARAEAELLAARQASYSSFFGGISALANAFQAQNRAQFIVQRALASASAGINSYLAFTKTLVDGGPFPFNTINAAGVLAAGLAQQVQIFSTPAPAFQNGGIVPGNSFSGDNVTARVNSGELVLNREQQKRLFEMANGAGGGNQTIVIRIGNTDFAKAVVNSVNSGAGGVVDARVVK